jgi:mannose-6-phosphate isomerase-like protein (cupin superfamily)
LNNYNDISLQGLSQDLTDEQGNHPTVTDVEQTEAALLAFAELHAVKPPLSMRDKILGNLLKLKSLEDNRQPFTLDNLPLLTPDANWLDWEAAVKGIEPAPDFEGVYMHLLENNEKRELNLAWVQYEVPEEVHHDVLESFILLEGTCECHIFEENGHCRVVKMRTGDYISFKIGEVHDIQITSAKPAKAILQWLKIAA